MTGRLLDGAVVTINGRNFTAVDEPPDEDGHGWRGFTCDDCGASLRTSDACADHECLTCAGCGEVSDKLPVVDAENGQRFCGETCHEDASERFWTAVWTS